MRDLVVMFEEQVFAKIAVKIAPDGMNMVRIVLRVVVFQKEGWTLNPIIMRLTFVEATGPPEINFIKSGLLDLLEIVPGHVGTNTLDVAFDHLQQSGSLGLIEFSAGDPDLLERFHFSLRF